MIGVAAYKLPKNTLKTLAGGTDYPDIIEIGGFAYLYYRESGYLVNLQAVSEKFKTWEEVNASLGGV